MTNQETRKVGFEGNTQIGPLLEVTTSYLQGKHGVEIRIESVNIDNSQSWVLNFSWLEQVGRGFDRQEYDDDEQESSETKSDEFALKTIVFSVCIADQRG